MTKTIVVESRDEFISRHGGDPMPVYGPADIPRGHRGERTSWWMLPDGAMISDDPNHPFREIPDDPIERARNLAAYQRLLADRLQQEYNALITNLHTQVQIYTSGSGPLPPGEALAEVKRLRTKIAEANERATALKTEYETLRGPTAAQRQAAAREERQAKARQFIADLYQACNVDAAEVAKQVKDAEEMIGGFFEEVGKKLNEAADARAAIIEQRRNTAILANSLSKRK